MELFNKYKNICFEFINNYITSSYMHSDHNLSKDEFKSFIQDRHGKFACPLLIKNNPEDKDDCIDLSRLFIEDEGYIRPNKNIYAAPIRLSTAEKSWLYMILKDPKSKLFIDDKTRESLIDTLDSEKEEYFLRKKYIDIKDQDDFIYDSHYIKVFKTIVEAIKSNRIISLENHARNGKIYKNQKYIPYKLEYSAHNNMFSLSAYSIDTDSPIKISLSNIKNVEILNTKNKFTRNEFENFYLKKIKANETEPLIIEIQNKYNAYDRFVHKFSSYNRLAYEKDGKFIVKLHYQYYERHKIIRDILSLGPYVKVISPEDIKNEIIEELKVIVDNYN